MILTKTTPVQRRDEFTATSDNETFVLTYVPFDGAELVYINGVLQKKVDYNITVKDLTFTVGAQKSGDNIIVSYVS